MCRRLLFHSSFLVLPSSLVLLLSCGPRPLLYSYRPVPTEGWKRTDTLRFELPERSSEATYGLSLGVRFADRMPYQDLWLVLERRIAEGKITTARRDTVHLPLGSDRGRWQVPGVVLREAEVPVDTIALTAGQHVTLLVYHVMSQQAIPNITEVGVKVD